MGLTRSTAALRDPHAHVSHSPVVSETVFKDIV